MSDDTKQCFIICGSIAAVLCSLIWSVFLYNDNVAIVRAETIKLGMESGYIQTVDPRSNYETLWVKAEQE